MLEPGTDFKLEVLTPLPLTLRQQVAPATLRFNLPGCDDFGLAAQGQSRLDLEVRTVLDGSFETEVPVSFMTSAGPTWARDSAPITGAFLLVATCHRDQRQVVAQVAYSVVPTAWSWTSYGPGTFADPAALLPLEGDALLALASGRLVSGAARSDGSFPAGYAEAFVPAGEAGARSLLASDGASAYLSSRCPLLECAPGETITVELGVGGQRTLPAQSLFEYALGDRDLELARRLDVPQHRDLAFDAGGDLVVLGSGIVTRIKPGQPPRYADIGAPLPQSDFTRLPDGRLAFLHWVTDHVELIAADGARVESYAGDETRTGSTLIDPKRPRWIVSSDSGRWLGGHPRSWQALEVDPALDFEHAQVTWLDDAVVLFDSKLAQLIPVTGSDRPAWRWSPESPPGQRVTLRGVAGTRRLLAVTTTSGVRLFDRSGALIGGSDPLPSGWAPTSAAVVQGQRALFTNGEFLLGLDLAGY
ncbi:MAG: hypothetical protein QM765_34705 [Myxococcales bacterium]